MFDERWITLFVFISMVGIVLRAPALAGLGLIGLTIAATTRLLERHTLRHVDYERRFSETRLFVDETVTISGHVANRGRLPVISLMIEDSTPRTFRLPSTHKSHTVTDGAERVDLTQLLALKPGEHTSRSTVVQATQRGYYPFGPARLRAFDILGLSLAERIDHPSDALIVYPRVYPLEKPGIPTRDPFGAMPAMRRLIEDPSLVMGSRDYEYGDSFRQIHWKATAHVGKLQTRVCEHTSDPTAMILLNVTTLEKDWHGTDVERFEWVLSVAGSLAVWASEWGCTVGLSSNGCAPNMPHAVRIPPRRAPNQLTRIMEGLAVLMAFTAMQFDMFLLSEQRHVPFGATIIVVTSIVTPAIEASLLRLHALGKRLILISADYTAPDLNTLPFIAYHVPPPEHTTFRQAVQISLGERGTGRT
ncbi:MAG: DUF58 domain-containing protein [Anaerolineae bacterium]|nr:DUF58 domain-containing protein [Thermoflexales bacterium]MDW8408942.1 DUF58 domain-containing protein [Anaerolineae bacterium]